MYRLTVEHLRYAGDNNLMIILNRLNAIINNVNSLPSPQLNTAVASVMYKGTSKSVYNHKSYRLVRVLPLIGRIFDEFVRPVFCDITRPHHNPNQYGFTAGLSYLLAAL